MFNGPGESIYTLCTVIGSPISPGPSVSRALNQHQKIIESQKMHKRTKTYKEARCIKQRALYTLYEKQQYANNIFDDVSCTVPGFYVLFFLSTS